jgi:transcriptional regulator with XRE-family HTH domain
MTFGEALQREIATQGIAVAEVAKKSGVSKGTIYNILNATTEEARIRAATRRAIARGCNRDLRVLPDGGVVFVAPETGEGEEASTEILFRFLPQRPFMSQYHLPSAFDWLYAHEENGALTGLQIVDRVFHRREDFLGIEVQNHSDSVLTGIQFDLLVAYDGSLSDKVSCRIDEHIDSGDRVEYTLFLMAGPAYELTVSNATYTDDSGQIVGIVSAPTYRFEGVIR